MARVTHKTSLATIDGTPKKRLFLSIISDYNLKTGLCELIDNALDLWVSSDRRAALAINITLDPDRQFIQVSDTAGGIAADQAELLVSPGASRNNLGESLIGIFGVGGKRAAIALGEHVEIRTRYQEEKSIQIDLTSDWIEQPSWDLEIFEIPDIDAGTTRVDITKVRQSFDWDEISQIEKHLGEVYSSFINQGCNLLLNKEQVLARQFDLWAYPPEHSPREAKFSIEPVSDNFLNVAIKGGLIRDRDPETENYGIYIYCNNRLIVKDLKSRDVGYFISSEAGVPHPDASLARVIVEYNGPAELMPWNSSKSGINFSHPAFTTIRRRIIDFITYYTQVSRRLKSDWEGNILNYDSGDIAVVDPQEALSNKRKILPKPPSTRLPTRFEILRDSNKEQLYDQPWILGLIETFGLVDVLGKQRFQTRNRASLILLDSNFEIALKEFIVHRKELFPAGKYNSAKLGNLFMYRTEVINEVRQHVHIDDAIINKINHYYEMRNNLIHQRATANVTDDEVEDYGKIIEMIITKLFDLKLDE